MITFLIALQAAASSPSLFTTKQKTYEQCVESSAVRFERAKEAVSETVSGAFAACKNERAEIILYMTDKDRKDGRAPWEMDRAERFVKDLIDERLRDNLTADLFKLRSR